MGDRPEFGGVYLGPGSRARPPSPDIQPCPPPPTSPPAHPSPPASATSRSAPPTQRTSSFRRLRGSFRRSKKEEEKKEEAVYGGVYVGPASSIPEVRLAVKVSKKDHGDEEEEEGKVRNPGLIRRLSRSKNSKPSAMPKGKVKCEICKKKCTGDILRADEKYFHIACFACKSCNRPLSEVGFFTKDGSYYCPSDYHAKFGQKCPTCAQFVEGEIIEFMGKAFHKSCFNCTRCNKNLPTGESVTWTGREQICADCLAAASARRQLEEAAGLAHMPTLDTSELHKDPAQPPPPHSPPMSPTACAACGHLISSGQVLQALNLHFHINCFKCTACSAVLHGEYMAKDGRPYCIRDYNNSFGVKCHECEEFIAGRVLQAGGYQFHPECASCSRCGEKFGDGAEMYMQGDEIWHPSCNDIKPPERIVHRHPSDKTHHRRHQSPKGPHRRRREGGESSGEEEEERVQYRPKYTVDFGKHLTYMYLLPEPTTSYLKQPIGPHPPQPHNFHTPKGPVKIRRARVSYLKTGMQKLAEQMESDHPRPKSPHMDNEEPIEASMYPAAHAPQPGEEPAIDREDFPAPMYPYAIEEIRKRLSESEPDDDEDEDFPDATAAKLEKKKKAEEELKKLQKDSSLAAHLAAAAEEEEKKRRVPLHIDPRSASRTPSAKKLPHFKCRYESAANASPSRYQNRPRPWEHWKEGRGATATIGYSPGPAMNLGLAPKSSTLPVGYANGDFPDHADLHEAYSNQSLEDTGTGRGGRMGGTMPLKDAGQRFLPPSHAAPPLLRTSLPDMSKPIRIYAYEELLTTNKKLPEDVDRCHLERHLGKEDFERLFHMTPMEFYKLPEWKRVNMKRKAHLF